MYRLSKSKLMSALQCPKRLYLEVHQPDLRAVDSGLQSRFDAGHRVGEVARSLYPRGRLIGHADDPTAALQETQAALGIEGDLLLFEPAFQHGGVLIRADLLFRQGGRHRLVEVKATTGVNDHHLQDVAIQAWVIDGAGCPIDAASIAHIDCGFVYPGGSDYRGLFKSVDVTDAVKQLHTDVPSLILRSQQVLAGPMPQIGVGRQCNTPYGCPFLDHCDRGSPDYPLSILSRYPRLVEELVAQGYRDLRDVPESAIGEGVPRRLWHASRSGIPFVDPNATDLLRGLDYPRYYLDFETIQFAVPIWTGTRPYEQLPFQWSCHVEHADGRLEHREFLDVTGDAPMDRCMETLIEALGTNGPIFTYSGFEGRIIREAAASSAQLTTKLHEVSSRLVDLLTVVRTHYYHPEQKGSWSMKAVLPTIAAELDYGNLDEIRDGHGAQQAYLELIEPATRTERKDRLVHALLVYCHRDTEGMVAIARHLCQ